MKYSLKAKVTKYNHQRPVLVRFVNSPVKLVIFSLNPKQIATKVFSAFCYEQVFLYDILKVGQDRIMQKLFLCTL